MKKKIKNINGWNIIWLLIYLMPFLICLGYTFIYAYGIKGNVTSFGDFNNAIVNYYLGNFYKFFGDINGFIAVAIRDLFSYFGVVVSYNILYQSIIPAVIQYIILISIIRIAVDVILMLPNIIHNFIDKLGGERE